MTISCASLAIEYFSVAPARAAVQLSASANIMTVNMLVPETRILFLECLTTSESSWMECGDTERDSWRPELAGVRRSSFPVTASLQLERSVR